MKKEKINNSQLYGFLPSDAEGMETLTELALDLRWSWNHAADELWKQLDPELWELTHNPWMVLQTVSRDRLERKLAEGAFRNKMDELRKIKELPASSPAWFQQTHKDAPLKCIAYFSM